MPGTRISILFVVAAGILFGTAGTAQALGPAGTTPIAVGVLRIQVGAVALLVAMPFLGHHPRRLLTLWRSPAMLVSAISAAVYQPLFFGAVSQVGVAFGTLVAVGSEPVLAGIVGWAVLRHRPTPGWIAATAVAVAGLVLLSSGSLGSGTTVGLLLALGSGLCSACYTVAAKVQLDRGVTALEVPTGSFVLGGLLLLPLLVGQPLAWVDRAVRHRAGPVPGHRHDGGRERAAHPRHPRSQAGTRRHADAHGPRCGDDPGGRGAG